MKIIEIQIILVYGTEKCSYKADQARRWDFDVKADNPDDVDSTMIYSIEMWLDECDTVVTIYESNNKEEAQEVYNQLLGFLSYQDHGFFSVPDTVEEIRRRQ